MEVSSVGSDDGVVVDDMETEAGEAGESRGDPTGQASASYGSCVHRFGSICPPLIEIEVSWSRISVRGAQCPGCIDRTRIKSFSFSCLRRTLLELMSAGLAAGH